jgi:hypothetical protein
MVSWYPILVIRLRSRCHGRAVGTGGWDALVSSAFLDCTALSTLAASAFLGEVGRDPDGVEEVDYADEARQDEEVKEDTGDVGQRRRRLKGRLRRKELTFEDQKC